MNLSISVVGCWIFDSNYKRSLVLNIESLDMICAPYIVEEQVAEFETVFTAVIDIFLDAHFFLSFFLLFRSP